MQRNSYSNNNMSIPISTTLPAFRPSFTTMEEYEFCGMIGPENVEGMSACPCCNRSRRNVSLETLDEPIVSNRGSLITDSSTEENDDDEEDVLPGVLSRGVEYHPKRILVEGWVHKKGTGLDFFGSRGWKPRWARLALAKVEGYDVDVPLFLIYWYRSSTHPTTVILLESTVVLAIDKSTNNWNSHRFEVRHVKQTETTEVQTTRTFTVPQKERDMWVCAISQALLEWEKRKAKARTRIISATAAADGEETFMFPQPRRSPLSIITDDSQVSSSSSRNPLWTGDQFVTMDIMPPHSLRQYSSPPASPRPGSKRPLPRHDVLAGESLA